MYHMRNMEKVSYIHGHTLLPDVYSMMPRIGDLFIEQRENQAPGTTEADLL